MGAGQENPLSPAQKYWPSSTCQAKRHEFVASQRLSDILVSPVLAGHSPGLERECVPTAHGYAALGRTVDAGTHYPGGVSEAGVPAPGTTTHVPVFPV